MFQTTGGGSTGQPKAQRKPQLQPNPTQPQISNQGGGPGGYTVSPMNPTYGTGGANQGAQPPQPQPQPQISNQGGGPGGNYQFDRAPGYPMDRVNISGDPGDAYHQIYAPAARRAQGLLKDRRGFMPIDMPALPELEAGYDKALDRTERMAGQNTSAKIAEAGANALGKVINQGGLAANTGGALGAMDDVVSGERYIGKGRYRSLYASPLSSQQQSAEGVYAGMSRGDGDVGTVGFGKALAGSGNAPQRRSQLVSEGIAQGERDVGTRRFYRLANEASGPSYSEQNVADMATMTLGENPYLDQIEDLVTDRISAEQRRAASAAGRGYGSGYEASQTADAITRAILEGRLSQYNADANRKLSANQQMDQQRLANANLRRGVIGDIANVQAGNVNRQQAGANALAALGNQLAANRLSAAGAVADINAANQNRRLSAAESLSASGQQQQENRFRSADAMRDVAAANIANEVNTAQASIGARQQGVQDQMRATALRPEVYATRYGDVDRLTNVGETRQNRADVNFADERDRRYQEQQAPFEQLNAYMALTGMTPQAGLGYQGTRDQLNANQPSALQQGIGTAGLVGGALNEAGVLQPALKTGGNVIENVIGGLF